MTYVVQCLPLNMNPLLSALAKEPAEDKQWTCPKYSAEYTMATCSKPRPSLPHTHSHPPTNTHTSLPLVLYHETVNRQQQKWLLIRALSLPLELINMGYTYDNA